MRFKYTQESVTTRTGYSQIRINRVILTHVCGTNAEFKVHHELNICIRVTIEAEWKFLLPIYSLTIFSPIMREKVFQAK